MPGTVPVPDFAGRHKDPKIALRELSVLIIREQIEHFKEWHTKEGMNDSDSDTDEEIDLEKEDFVRKAISSLKEEMRKIKACKDGYTALPPFVMEQLDRFGKELKMSLCNQMIISVKNGGSHIFSTLH